MKILAVGAHPDDIEYSCYGFLRKMLKKGCEVYLLVMSMGERGTDPREYNREREQRSAFEASGFNGIFTRNYKDGELICNVQMISDIESVVKQVGADLVLTHYTEDHHQDHRAVAQATIAACRNAGIVLFYQSYSTLNFIPEIYVNIDREIEEKRGILQCFFSQLKKNTDKGTDFVECAVATNRYHGVFSRSEYAEGFRVFKIIM